MTAVADQFAHVMGEGRTGSGRPDPALTAFTAPSGRFALNEPLIRARLEQVAEQLYGLTAETLGPANLCVGDDEDLSGGVARLLRGARDDWESVLGGPVIAGPDGWVVDYIPEEDAMSPCGHVLVAHPSGARSGDGVENTRTLADELTYRTGPDIVIATLTAILSRANARLAHYERGGPLP